MSKQIAITDSFLQSVFKLNSQDKKLAFSTAKQLSENPTAFNHIGTQQQNYGSATEAELNYEKLVECEKYVAVTRARDKVIITYLGE